MINEVKKRTTGIFCIHSGFEEEVFIICHLKRNIMVKENILLDKSLNFAGRIVKLHKYLIKIHKESVISRKSNEE